MNVLEVIQRVTKAVGMAVPTRVYSSPDRSEQELGALANKVAEEIAASHDWQRLRRLGTITGTGTAQSFDRPYDFDRMPEGTTLRDSEGPLEHVIDHDLWLDWQLRGYAPAYGSWSIIGDRFEVLPIPTSGKVMKFWYQSNRIVRGVGTLATSGFPYNLPFELADSGEYGTAKTSFTADDDFFQLSWRLHELGMLWQWKAGKGLPYQEDFVSFEVEKARLVKRERGPRMIAVAGRTYMDDFATPAYDRTLRPA